MKHKELLKSVQYLRAIAAMTVSIYHIGNHAGVHFETGACGVDVFFIISGFIMWSVTSGKKISPQTFIIDRVTRIAPPYAVLTIVTYLTALYVPAIFPNMKTDFFHFAMSLLFVPHVDPLGSSYPQIVSGWTLNYEMFFYVIFSFCLLIKEEARAMFSVSALVSLSVVGFFIDTKSPLVRTYTNPLLLEFCAGICLAKKSNTLKRCNLYWGLLTLTVGVIALFAWQLIYGMDPESYRFVIWGVPSLLIVAGLLIVDYHQKLFSIKTLSTIGNASFSIYLVNAFTVAASWRIMKNCSLPIYYIVAVLVSTMGGIAFWWLVERPLTRFVRRKLHRPVPIVDNIPI